MAGKDSIYKELQHYGTDINDAEIISDKDGVIVARVRQSDRIAVLKYFEKKEFTREIRNYEILHSLDIPTLKVLGKTETSILLEDIEHSDTWRLGMEEDLDDPDVIKAIAKWYRMLHDRGQDYVNEHGSGMYDEWDSFTRENILAVRDRFGLEGSEGIKAVLDHYDELKKIIDEIPRTLAYNDFYYTNLAVRKDKSQALMFDYNLLGKGCRVSDVNNVIYWFSENNKKAFFSVYGDIDERLMIVDRTIAPIISLHSAMERDIFPEWAKEVVDELEYLRWKIEYLIQ